MAYTVKEIAKLAGVTVKTLHHYHKIGLLNPSEITEVGYRLYGEKEMEYLQQILFYREMDISLSDIKRALAGEVGRVDCLTQQREMLSVRKQRLECMLSTINESIVFAMKGETMDKKAMFQGLNKEEWQKALTDQTKYVKEKYGYDMMENKDINATKLNEQAAEAQKFTKGMAHALKSGWKVNDGRVIEALEAHLAFLNDHGISVDAKGFVGQTRFFLEDDFHRAILENEQTGLAYYLCIAAETYAAENQAC